MTQFQGDQSKINACTMEKKLKILKQDWSSMKYLRRDIDINVERMEYILPTRLADETFSGMMNFIKVAKDDASTDQFQKALVSQTHPKQLFNYSDVLNIF